MSKVYEAKLMSPISNRNMSFYEKYIKRLFDIICSLLVIVLLSPLLIVLAIMVKAKLGSPIIFTQDRPGLISKNGKETIFKMYKFRTMTNQKDKDGNWQLSSLNNETIKKIQGMY